MHVIYLPGIAGYPGPSPALAALNVEIVVPELPGFAGEAGFESPPDHLAWLTATWDALDATGAPPCPVIGASVGAMLAAELAILRPEAVTKLALLAPFGIADADHPGEDYFARLAQKRLALAFAKEIPEPFSQMFAERGEADAGIARYIQQIAAASLVWPLGDRGLARRVHRLRVPSIAIWGEDDRLTPVALASRWPVDQVVTIAGAGHLVEWDAPEAVTAALRHWL